MFRIAYDRNWQWDENFTNEKDTRPAEFVEIPITVLQGRPSADDKILLIIDGEQVEEGCDKERWKCDIKEQLGITTSDYWAFFFMGVQAWIRAWPGMDPVVY